jgi:uncharacterized protein YndB with AHSA1/START domain
MKFLIKFVMVMLFVAIGGAYLYGRGLPREHVATSSILLIAPADSVFALIRNVGGSAAWWNDVKSVERIRGAARESWRQDMGPAGTIDMEVTSVVPGRSMVTTILNSEEQGWGGVWYYQVNNSSSGTEITITEEGWVDSPVMRTIMKFRGSHRTIDSYLRSIGSHFGEMATPRHG